MDFKNADEFIVTVHGRDMLLLRFGCNEGKIKKVAMKAWRSRVSIDKLAEYRKHFKYEEGIYRLYNGCVFVFVLVHGDRHGNYDIVKKKLITVYNPNKDVVNGKSYG